MASFDPWALFDGTLFSLGLSEPEIHVLAFALIALILVDLIRYVQGKNLADFLMEQNLWFRWTIMLLLIASVVVFGIYGPDFSAAEFIHFQF